MNIKLLTVIFLLCFCICPVNAETYKPEINGEQIEINDFGGKLTLENNPGATDPTYEELMNFIKEDKTNEYLVINCVRACGWYSQTAHNNAEKEGICAGVVLLMPEDGSIGHGFLMTHTQDKGLVYFDCMYDDMIVDLGEGYRATSIYNSEDVRSLDSIEDCRSYYFW